MKNVRYKFFKRQKTETFIIIYNRIKNERIEKLNTPKTSCCKIMLNTGKSAFSKAFTSTGLIEHTILKLKKFFIISFPVYTCSPFRIINLHKTHFTHKAIVSNRAWLNCGLLGFLDIASNLTINWPNTVSRNGIALSLRTHIVLNIAEKLMQQWNESLRKKISTDYHCPTKLLKVN